MKGNTSDKKDPSSELCDWCGAVIRAGSEAYRLTPESLIHPGNPQLGDRHLPRACSKEHLAALDDHYRRRPFVQEELWAGRIARAMENAAGELTAKDLTTATGLDLEQIERCRAWLEAQLYRQTSGLSKSGDPDHLWSASSSSSL